MTDEQNLSKIGKILYVNQLFTKIASKYDFMNDLMTLGLHRLWKKQACELLKPHGQLKGEKNIRFLDLACGTGDLSFLLAKIYPESFVTGIDFNEEMLEVAKNRLSGSSNIQFIQGDILKLPFEDNQFDRAIISFGLRNVENYEKCLQEIYRVCKNNSRLVILDLSHPNGIWRSISSFYRFQLVPIMGKIFAKAKDEYNYLPNSINNYPNQEGLCDLLKKCNWSNINYQNIFGGVAAIHKAEKI